MPQPQESSDSNREIEATPNINNTRVVINNEGTCDVVKSQNSECDSKQEADEQYPSSTDILYSEYCWHDLLLLENQIPFFVIQTIHELIVGGSGKASKLIENVAESVEGALSCYPKAICKSNRPKDFHHLLHLCHMYFKPCWTEVDSHINHLHPPTNSNLHQLGRSSSEQIDKGSFDEDLQWHRATEYHLAGIDFRKRTFSSENPHSLLDIEFLDGVIEIPCLTIEPNTYSLLCNLIAFEQTCPQFGSFITTYIMFLFHLLSMPEDVSLLTERGIIAHNLSSDAEVSNLFKEISKCIVSDFDNDSCLVSLCQKLEAHYQSQKPTLRKILGSLTSKYRRRTQKNKNTLKEMSHPGHAEYPHWRADLDYGKWVVTSRDGTVHISAKAMNIIWGSDHRFWQWVDLPESESCFKVGAELVQVSWIEVTGILDIAKLNLSQPTWFEIIYLIKFKTDSFGWNQVPITFEAGTSNTAKKNKSVLLEPYREQNNKWHEVSGGCVEVKPDMAGYLEFGMLEVETKWWKGGMVFEGVKMRPIIK